MLFISMEKRNGQGWKIAQCFQLNNATLKRPKALMLMYNCFVDVCVKNEYHRKLIEVNIYSSPLTHYQ